MPTPRTQIIRADCDLVQLVDGIEPDGFAEFVATLAAAGETMGWPCFLRTGVGSGKHSWSDTCHVPEASEIAQHVFNLVEWSSVVDLFGLPVDEWVIRDLLIAAHTAFEAAQFRGLPVGEVAGWHGYWPSDAFKGSDLPDGWQQALALVNEPAPGEVDQIHASTSAIASAFAGCPINAWSVDWMLTTAGSACIDMAPAALSWCWDEAMQVL